MCYLPNAKIAFNINMKGESKDKFSAEFMAGVRAEDYERGRRKKKAATTPRLIVPHAPMNARNNGNRDDGKRGGEGRGGLRNVTSRTR